jgi:hypothetical protein
MNSGETVVHSSTPILDNRPEEAFKTVTLSNYRRSDVRRALVDSMLRDKIEPACHWCAELIVSGHFADIWEVCFHFMSKYVHLGNPKLPIYIERRYARFREKMSEGAYFREMDARNDHEMRHIFIELVCVLTASLKKNSLEHLRIDRQEEFDMTKNAQRLKAPSLEYAGRVMKPGDPRELSVALNELLFHIESRNSKHAFYWIDWLIEFDAICRSKKAPCLLESRAECPVAGKFQSDLVWVIWDAIKHYSDLLASRGDVFVQKCVAALFALFCVRYTNACAKKRRFTMYHAVCLLTEPMDARVELFRDKGVIGVVMKKIDDIFLDVKRHEITDAMELKNEKQMNFEKSMNKMKMIRDMEGL